jgi:hypothetical protein
MTNESCAVIPAQARNDPQDSDPAAVPTATTHLHGRDERSVTEFGSLTPSFQTVKLRPGWFLTTATFEYSHHIL